MVCNKNFQTEVSHDYIDST